MASRPARNRRASSRVTDGANGEAPSAMAAKPILDLIKKIGRLSALLPETVGKSDAPADGDIHHIITRVEHPDGTVAAHFNRRFDILFSEDTRSSDGCLKIHWEMTEILFDLTKPKLTRVAEELEDLCGAEDAASFSVMGRFQVATTLPAAVKDLTSRFQALTTLGLEPVNLHTGWHGRKYLQKLELVMRAPEKRSRMAAIDGSHRSMILTPKNSEQPLLRTDATASLGVATKQWALLIVRVLHVQKEEHYRTKWEHKMDGNKQGIEIE
ncbi:hypothetical protein K438DRAFT_1768191 [Mycena galopus ATCC 62051]|nr:hypothetical protein K438DRAFT_1768191 [Mycena galopus ATCC 62051]